MVLNVPCLNGPSNHVIRPFENGTKKCHKGQIFVFQMFGIQMVIVFFLQVSKSSRESSKLVLDMEDCQSSFDWTPLYFQTK